MKLADVSIRRPVFATMMIAVIVVFGITLYTRLSTDMFPEVDFPLVTVQVIYPGADPETMERQVADPIEEAVNSLSGIRSLRSYNVESVSQVVVEFDLDVPIDIAVQDVRDRLATIISTLPNGIEEPVVQKLDFGAAPVLQLAVSGGQDPAALTIYVEETLKPALERVSGVGQVEIVGGREREVHVWVDPEALRSYHLTIMDVVNALPLQNFELPAGRIEMGPIELVVRTDSEATTVADLAEMALTTANNTVVRLSDVARVEDGFEEARSAADVNGEPAIAVVIRKQSDANTVEVAHRIEEVLPQLRETAPAGTNIAVLVNNADWIEASIESVQFDLILGALLAVAIIFLFLRDMRATIISGLALPISVIGAFGFVEAMGFTLNVMTTLALSLSIGILIDDAIVVIENIVRRRSKLHEPPKVAAMRGTAEIGLAVLATTLSIVAVFIPVAFMEGMIGQFFYEFGLTVAFAVLLSLFVSFTLTPMLSSIFLKEHKKPWGPSALVEWMLVKTEGAYRRIIGWALRHNVITFILAVGVFVGTMMALAPRMGFEFIAITDSSQFGVRMELPTGTSLSETKDRAEAIAERLREVPGVDTTFTTVGGGTQELVNTASIVVKLLPRDQRAYHQTEAMAHVRRMFEDEGGGLILSVEELDTVGGGGGQRQAEVQLDLLGNDLAELSAAADRIVRRLEAAGGFVDVASSHSEGKPQLDIILDRRRADDLGVNATSVAMTARALLAGQVATQFQSPTERYDVRVQLPEEYRESQDAVAQAQVRAANGQLVEIGDVATIGPTTGPSGINRLARQRLVSVMANLEGKALGAAIEEAFGIAFEEVPPGVSVALGGQSQMLGESMASMGQALLLAILCIYMILAAQFESFIHPFTIMTALPFSLIGAIGGLVLTGMNMSIFGMIGLIMLMGLVTKNGILLVDFANQRRAAGMGVKEALIDAGATRLRPILMTTAAMIFGMLPVAIGHGDGGEMRRAMGVTVIGGLITSTILTLVVVPVIYHFMDWISHVPGRIYGWLRPKAAARRAERKRRLAEAEAAAEAEEAHGAAGAHARQLVEPTA